VFDRYLGRVAVAQLPVGVASALTERARGAIAYWRERTTNVRRENGLDLTFASNRLELFIEFLSRLSPRQDAQGACASFNLAMDLGNDASLRDPGLFEPIGNLARYSFEAVRPVDRSDLVLAALEFPLSAEKGVGMGPVCPSSEFLGQRAG
jgi:hypothetical protein